MTKCTLTSPRTVMVSGFFEGIHTGHIEYFLQAMELGDIICIVASDKQLMMKRGRIKIPEEERLLLAAVVLEGIRCHNSLSINHWDTETTLISEALGAIKPDILFRGYDKKLETMPESERKVCQELGIEVIHAKNRIGERHSSEIFKGGNYDYNKNTI